MARRSAEGTARLALFGAGSDAGTRLRSELASRGVPGSRVALFGARRGETVVSEYDGEARLLQEPDLDVIADHDLVFFCEAGKGIATLASRADVEGRLVDLTGTLRAPLAHEPLRPAPPTGPIGIPHPLAIVLAELIAPLKPLGTAWVTATVLRPAADRGDAGLEELREQTLRLLRFESPPTEVFGRQLAFNLIPQALLPGEGGLEARVRSEVTALLGPDGPEIAIAIVAVPIFHGHGIVLLAGGPDLSAARALATLAEAGTVVVGARAALTPMDAPEVRRTDAGLVAEGGDGTVRLWAIAAEAGSAAARQALAVAARRAAI